MQGHVKETWAASLRDASGLHHETVIRPGYWIL